MNSAEVVILADQPHGIQADIDNPVRIRADRRQAWIDDDLVVSSPGFVREEFNKILRGLMDVLRVQALDGLSANKPFRCHHYDKGIILNDQVNHLIQSFSRSGDRIKYRRAGFGTIVMLQRDFLIFNRRIVDTEGY